jgi:histidinol-phosphatase (PHP family)
MPEKIFSSLHTHTTFCDGKDDVETMCRAAAEKGLAAIGFSAHAPVGKTGLKTNWHIKDQRLEEYVGEVNSARRRWEGKIAVSLGLEVDYIKGLRSPLDRDIRELNLDYVIGSVHYLVPPRGEPFTVDGPANEMEKGIDIGFGGDSEAMMHAYWDAVMEMIAVGGFDIVGHIDLIKKTNDDFNGGPGRWFSREGGAYMRRFEEVAAAVSASGLVVELSTGALNRRYHSETYPSLPLLRILRGRNVPVMISADAHRAADLDGFYPQAMEMLHKAGYESHVIFEGRQNGKPQWKTVSK